MPPPPPLHTEHLPPDSASRLSVTRRADSVKINTPISCSAARNQVQELNPSSHQIRDVEPMLV